MKIDSPKHPLRYYLIEYYNRRYGYKLGILNPGWIISLRNVKKHLGPIKQSVTAIEKIKKDTILFYITPQKYSRPILEIFKRIETI